MARSWFVAATRPRAELRALEQLERQRYHCFLPQLRKRERHPRRSCESLIPVFPGYIFVQFDPACDQWYAINGTLGVKRLVGPNPAAPQPVPPSVIEALMGRCSGNVMGAQPSELYAGKRVRLTAGPLADQLATIERLDSRDRVGILLSILGRDTRATVPIRDLCPA